MIGPQPRTSTEKGKTKEEEWVKKKRKKQQHNGENILSQTSQGDWASNAQDVEIGGSGLVSEGGEKEAGGEGGGGGRK